MAIYQAPKRRWRLAIATLVVGLLLGFGVGVVVGRSGQPSPATVLKKLDADLDDVAALIEVFELEYKQARSGSATELAGARDALSRAKARYDTVRPSVRAVHRDAARAIDNWFEIVEDQVRSKRPPATVERSARQLRGLLGSVVVPA